MPATMSRDTEGDVGYNNSNRAFLQAFIARSALTFEEAQPMLAAILTVHGKESRVPCEDIERADGLYF